MRQSTILYKLVEFDFCIDMFASPAIAAIQAAPVQTQGKDLMEPRLLATFINAGVSEATMNMLGMGGVRFLALLTLMSDTKEDLFDFLERTPWA